LLKILKNLSDLQETILVLVIAFGYFIYTSNKVFIANLYSVSTTQPEWLYTNYPIIKLLIIEVVAFAIIIFILWARGYQFNDFKIKLSWRSIGASVLLVIIINFTISLIFEYGFKIEGSVKTNTEDFPVLNFEKVNWIVLIALGVINSIFEEFFLLGYLQKRVSQPYVFILISVLIRLSYHTYYFESHILFGICWLGLIHAIYLLKFKNLLPPILAHTIRNLSFFFY
jgi:membrane protease YdiL (CAAX protease family)